ncbi:MAG: hypothetical protein IPL52_10660 [Flavobacteriales bacterium]|nr:hypothetical protein [Flavobacteriales bacterium]
MNKPLLSLALTLAATAASAQFQVNPQAGVNFQQLTSPMAGVEYKANIGWQFGADLRFGDRLYVQPGAFFGRSATAVKTYSSDTLLYENDLVRTNLKLKGMIGYRIIDSYQFDLRFAMGPTYDAPERGRPQRRDRLQQRRLPQGLHEHRCRPGLRHGTGDPGTQRELRPEPCLQRQPAGEGHRSKYLTYGMTLGINLGNDD